MNKPMTTRDLFNKICNILKEKGRLPDILEYGSAASNPVPVTTYEYELGSKLAYGGNEGIYLDIWMEYSSGREESRQKLGVFKTLYESADAMRLWGRWFYRNEIGCKCIGACKVDGNGRTIELQREFGVGDGYSRTGMHFRSIGILVLCSRALRYRVYRKRFVKECEEQQGCQNERTSVIQTKLYD